MGVIELILTTLLVLSSVVATILRVQRKRKEKDYEKLAYNVQQSYTTIRKAAESPHLSNDVIARCISDGKDIEAAAYEVARRLNP